MSHWQPTPGNGQSLRRELRCYGKPTSIARVERMVGIDGFDYVAMAGCDAGKGTLVCKAKACSLREAQVVADALGKYVRHMAMRKASRDARREIRRGSVEHELIPVGCGGGEA
jgi:hypothetical protein